MTKQQPHISVCICTFRRPNFLNRLLKGLQSQDTGGLFTYSIVVADNDRSRSAELVVNDFAKISQIPIKYCVEPRQNIALARNKAIDNAGGEFIAFIDDDEFPGQCWLLTLFNALSSHKADGALGPVKPYFDVEPPQWVIKGKFWERKTYPTGFVIDWKEGRTNNVLLRRQVFDADKMAFRPEFRSGEDQDFFRRMIEKGHTFIWCNEAVAYEAVPPIRWKPTFMLKRALLQGTVSLLHPTLKARDLAKSVIAVPVYLAASPFALLLGYHWFMHLLVKLCNHLGRLLALVGINPVREPYVTN